VLSKQLHVALISETHVKPHESFFINQMITFIGPYIFGTYKAGFPLQSEKVSLTNFYEGRLQSSWTGDSAPLLCRGKR